MMLDLTIDAQTYQKDKKQRKRDKLGFIKICNFCATNYINKVKRQHTEWKKISVNHIYDKGLISRICKDL